jgi:hypothetical protein
VEHEQGDRQETTLEQEHDHTGREGSMLNRLITSKYWLWAVPIISVAVIATAVIMAFVADH